MTNIVSAGVYENIVDKTFVVNGTALASAGIVISANRGPIEPTIITSAPQFVAHYGLPSRDNPSMYSALRFLNRVTPLTVVRVVNDAEVATGVLVEDTEDHLEVQAANPGAWGNDVEVSFSTIVGIEENSGIFGVIVTYDGTEVERFEVSRDPDAKNGFGSSIFIEDVINRRSRYIRVDDNPAVEADYDLSATITLSGGSNDTTAPSSGDIIQGFELMANEEEVEAQILINGGWASPEVHLAMIAVANQRTDCRAILDVPGEDSEDIQAMIDYRDELGSIDYLGGLYGGWIEIYDQYNDREVFIPPSGDVAAAFVETFSAANMWDAPAGLRRGVIPNALGVSKTMNQADRDLLYINQINPVTSYGGANAVIWGQKTLQKVRSSLDRFNVVNNVLWITGACSEALDPFVFEPNNRFTRDNIEYILTRFLENIQEQGGLYGFHVQCDENNNPAQVIQENEKIVDIYIQPTLTGEKIRLNVIVTPTGVELG